MKKMKHVFTVRRATQADVDEVGPAGLDLNDWVLRDETGAMVNIADGSLPENEARTQMCEPEALKVYYG